LGVPACEFRVDNRSEILFWIPEGATDDVPDEWVPVEGALARLAPGVSMEAARADDDGEAGAGFRVLRRRRRDLIERVYEVDPRVCPNSQAEMRVVALIMGAT
jgi:hypothetical protein